MSTEVLTPEESAKLASTSLVAVDRVKLAAFKGEWAENLEELKGMLKGVALLSTPAEEQWGADQLTRVAAAYSEMEEDRKRVVRPLLDDKKMIDDDYAKSTKPALELQALLKDLLGRSAKARLEAVRALEAKAATLAAAGDDEGCQQALAVIPEATKIHGASTTLVWEGTLVDITKAPTHLLTANDKAVAALCKAHDAAGTTPTEPGFSFQRVPHTRRTAGKKT